MPKAPLYFVVLGESGVGKTSFTDKVAHDTQYHRYDIFQSAHTHTHIDLQVNDEICELYIMDVSLTPIRANEHGFVHGFFETVVKRTDGLVLLYDITSEESYRQVTEFGWDYAWACRGPADNHGLNYPTGQARFGCVLVGNKVDLVQGENSEKREVPRDLAEEWASMVGVKSFEVDRFDKSLLEDVLRELIKSTMEARERDQEDIELVRDMQKAKGDAVEEPEKQKQKSRRFPSLSRLKGILPNIR